MAKSKGNLDHFKGGMVFEWLCCEFDLNSDRTPALERDEDRELVNSWLQAIHGFELNPFSAPMVSASFGELDEETE